MYRRDYVALAGLFSLKDGVNTEGSAASESLTVRILAGEKAYPHATPVR